MTDGDGELVCVWLIAGALISVGTWAVLWATYGLWAALLGWIPGLIIGVIAGFIVALFWRALLGVVLLAALGLWFLSTR